MDVIVVCCLSSVIHAKIIAIRMKDIEFLKKRSREFWENAQELFKKGKYNLCVFNLEQAVQLWLKYLIGKKIGDWPKTHYIDELIKDFAKAYDNTEILEYFKEKEMFFEHLTDAYFVSRYYPREFSENLAEKMIKGCEEFFKLTEEIGGEKFL